MAPALIPLLDNVTWHALVGPHARYAEGTGDVRRYARGFSPIVGFADCTRPDLDTLARHCDPGEHFYSEGWSGAAPSGWRIEVETTMLKMVWAAGTPKRDEARDAVALNSDHAQRALELALALRPGPFGLRTIELGEYLGVLDGERLVAMAGERMHAGRLREISGVCTLPDYQGRGYARRLMLELVRRQLLRSETPFLHVMSDNTAARGLYERMGFRAYRETVVRVIAPA